MKKNKRPGRVKSALLNWLGVPISLTSGLFDTVPPTQFRNDTITLYVDGGRQYLPARERLH